MLISFLFPSTSHLSYALIYNGCYWLRPSQGWCLLFIHFVIFEPHNDLLKAMGTQQGLIPCLEHRARVWFEPSLVNFKEMTPSPLDAIWPPLTATCELFPPPALALAKDQRISIKSLCPLVLSLLINVWLILNELSLCLGVRITSSTISRL